MKHGKSQSEPNCNACQHHVVTWDANNPRGCRAYGFKGRQSPHLVVLSESGTPCQLFEPKQPPVRRSSRAGS